MPARRPARHPARQNETLRLSQDDHGTQGHRCKPEESLIRGRERDYLTFAWARSLTVGCSQPAKSA